MLDLRDPRAWPGCRRPWSGALCMNAGTSTFWMLDWVSEVEVVVPGEREARWVPRELLPAAYRSSGMPAGTVFLGCRMRLASSDPALLRATANRLRKAKAASQPLALPSAGCVFRNPRPDLPAGRLIDELGLKGTRIGGALISTVHANFIVNPERAASAADVCALIRLVRERAWRERGVVLCMEVEAWNCPECITIHPRVGVGVPA